MAKVSMGMCSDKRGRNRLAQSIAMALNTRDVRDTHLKHRARIASEKLF